MVQELVEKAFAIGKTRILRERHTLHTVERENQAGEMQIQNIGELQDKWKHGHIASRIQTVVENLKETLQLSRDKKFSSCIRTRMQAWLDENQMKLTDYV